MIIPQSKPRVSFCHGIIKRVGRVLIVKPETPRRLLDAYDEAFKLLGQPSFAKGVQHICKELQKQLNLLRAARTRYGLEAMLAKEPEPGPAQLDASIGAIRLIPYQMRKATMDAAKTLPHSPGGRPRVLTPKDGMEICAQIGALISQSVTLSDAVKRMAERYNVGQITIRRVWQSRGKPTVEMELPTVEPKTNNVG